MSVDRVLTAYRVEMISKARDKDKKQKDLPARDPGLSFQAVAAASNARGNGSKKSGKRGGAAAAVGLLSEDEDAEPDPKDVRTSDDVSARVAPRHLLQPNQPCPIQPTHIARQDHVLCTVIFGDRDRGWLFYGCLKIDAVAIVLSVRDVCNDRACACAPPLPPPCSPKGKTEEAEEEEEEEECGRGP